MNPYEILNSLASHISVIDSNGIIQFVNESWLDFAQNNDGDIEKISKGTSYVEVCEKACKTDKLPEVQSALDGIKQLLLGELDTFEIEYPCHSPLEKRWFLMRCSKMATHENLIVISHINISRQKELEIAIREEQDKYQTVVEALMVGVAIVNLDGIIQYANSAFSELYQYTNNELIGMHATQIIHPDFRTEFNRFTEELAATGRFTGSTIDIRKDGSTFHTEISGVAIWYKGSPCLLAVVHDVSDKIKAEAARKQVQELYTALFENNHSMILLLDPLNGKIVDANPSACEFYGYPRLNMQNMNISQINVHSKPEIKTEMTHAATEEKNYFNFKHRLANGSTRDVEVFSGPIKVSKKTLICSIIHDISERKAFEQEREKLIEQLQNAIEEIKTLRGIIPICAHCKKIRDDQGYWQQIEKYITEHSEAKFSHGLCPDCIVTLYPDFVSSNKD